MKIKIPRAVQIRRLKEAHDYLTPSDIAKLTGISPSTVKIALASGTKNSNIR